MKFAAVAGVCLSLLAVLMLAVLPAANAVGGVFEQARERGIVIVPLEPPPLTFGPGVDLGAALGSHVGAGMSYSLSETTAQAGRALWVLSGIVMLVDAPRQSWFADRQAQSAEALLNAQDLWVPTVVIAREAQAMLQAAASPKCAWRAGTVSARREESRADLHDAQLVPAGEGLVRRRHLAVPVR